MLKIKLARFGQKGQPHYRIVVNEARDKRDGQYIAKLGHYAPTQSPKLLELDLKTYQAWLAKGAQPTPTVASLAQKVSLAQKKTKTNNQATTNKAKAKGEHEKSA